MCLSGQQSHFLLEVASAGRAGDRDGCHFPWMRPICLNKPHVLSSRNTCFCWFSLSSPCALDKLKGPPLPFIFRAGLSFWGSEFH